MLQVGYLPELYEDARSEKYKILVTDILRNYSSAFETETIYTQWKRNVPEDSHLQEQCYENPYSVQFHLYVLKISNLEEGKLEVSFTCTVIHFIS
jgi:hypothetical protein